MLKAYYGDLSRNAALSYCQDSHCILNFLKFEHFCCFCQIRFILNFLSLSSALILRKYYFRLCLLPLHNGIHVLMIYQSSRNKIYVNSFHDWHFVSICMLIHCGNLNISLLSARMIG